MTDASIIELYFRRSERAINESQASYGGYCYRVADGILRDARDSEESVNDTWLAAWNAIPPTRPNCLKAYFGALTRRISVDRLRRRSAAKRGGGEALIALEELAECIPSGFSVERTIENKLLIQSERERITAAIAELSTTTKQDSFADQQKFLDKIRQVLEVLENPLSTDIEKGNAINSVVEKIVFDRDNFTFDFSFCFAE